MILERPICIEKSIAWRLLIFKNWGDKAEIAISYAGALLFVILGLMLLISKYSSMSIIGIVIVVLFCAWMIANMVLLNLLIKFKGFNIDFNREAIINTLNDYYNLSMNDVGQITIENVKPSGFIYFGRIITVLLDNDSVYLNIQSLGRGDSTSPFHGFSNYLKSKRISKLFLTDLRSRSVPAE